MKKAFTLAEIMIVLTVIGILTAILLPVAFQAAPDERVMKFKKANSTLGTVIRELTNSDRYYLNGDLGIRSSGTSSGTTLTATATNYTYFCQSFAELLSTKRVSCSSSGGYATHAYSNAASAGGASTTGAVTNTTLGYIKGLVDTACSSSQAQSTVGAEIITTDDVTWFQANPQFTFGMAGASCSTGSVTTRQFASPALTGTQKPCHYDNFSFDVAYKIMCLDVDGLSTTCTTVNTQDQMPSKNGNVCPFGYAIRADGKIIPGARADAWMNFSTQKK